MSLPALQRDGAELAQDAADEMSIEAREAQKLADDAAAFCLFGLRIALDEEAYRRPISAEQAYKAAAEGGAPAANTNDRAFPVLTARGLHLPASSARQLVQALDWAIVLLVAECAALWGAGGGLLSLSIGQAASYLGAALGLKVGFWLTDYYRFSPASFQPGRGLGGLALGAIIALAAAALFAPDARGAAAISAVVPVAALLLAGVHAALALWIKAAHRAGAFAETVVLIGATEAAERLAKRAATNNEARIVAVIDDRRQRSPSSVAGAPVCGDIEALLAWEGLPHVDRIVVTVTQKAEARVRAIIARLGAAPNRVDLLLDYEALSVRGKGVERLTGAAVACVSGRPRQLSRELIKRVQDLIATGILLTAFAAPMLLIALAIKCDSKGPVLYRQQRHGFNNRIITVLKFRTMRHDPDASFAQVRANDPRVTRLGRFLRRTSLDELPQLFNVLGGAMSLVGPRPHAVDMKAADRDLKDIVAEYAHRHRVKPGITGWAQVNGSRGPVDSPAALRQRVKLDLDYVARSSLWFDLHILLRTAPALLGDTKVTR